MMSQKNLTTGTKSQGRKMIIDLKLWKTLAASTVDVL